MFENLGEKLTGIFQRLQSRGRLTEKDMDDVLLNQAEKLSLSRSGSVTPPPIPRHAKLTDL